jgi:ATP-binding cassette subfamily F protein 1
VAEEPPGLRSKKGKEEKSKGKAKVRGGPAGGADCSSGSQPSIRPVFSLLPQSKPAAADSEGEEEEEDTAKEKEPPQQGKDRDKKEAEQVCAHCWGGRGRGSSLLTGARITHPA